MTVGFFSPLPPARTGVADYSAALLAAMRSSGKVRENETGDINLYHLGNNRLHGEIYDQALAEPGIIVLHDAVLNHFFLGRLSNEEYVAEVIHNYGAWNEELARRLWDSRARSGTDPLYFAYPMLRRIVECSRAVIVHNMRAEALARGHGASAVHRIPHLHDPLPAMPGYEVVRLRNQLGVRPTDLLLGVFGHLRETKRIATILRAFGRVRRERKNVTLLVAGEFVSSDLVLALSGELDGDGIVRTGYLEGSDFALHAAATDICLNLRWPSAGETSGIAVRMMGLGKCVAVTVGEETRDFPYAAVLKVDAGPAEEDMLTAFLFWLSANPGIVREIGARAAAHIAEHHEVGSVAASYWRVIADCYHEEQRTTAVT